MQSIGAGARCWRWRGRGHRALTGRPAFARRPRRRSASATGRSRPACRSSSRVEKGYFKEAGLDVEALKFAGAQQVMEAMLSGRADGSANGTGSANLAIGELAQPGTFKIFATNPSNAKYVLDEFIVREGQPVQDDRRAQGQARRLGSRHPERDAREDRCSRRAGADAVRRSSSCRSASTSRRSPPARSTPCYTLEPTGTVGRMNGTTRVLEAGVIAKYILGDPMAPWHGGSASADDRRSSRSIRPRAKKYIAAYAQGHRARAHASPTKRAST